MKLLLTLVTTIALTTATTVDNKYDLGFNNHFNYIHDRHYSQHQSSVDSARNTMQERLSKLENQQRQYSSGGSENYLAPSGCSSCVSGGSGSGSTYNSRSSTSSSSSSLNSRSSSSGGVGADYVGVGIVGNAADGHLASSNRYSNAYEQDDLQQRVVPGDLNGVQASAYRASETEHDEDEDDVQRSLGVGFRDAAANNDRFSYSQRRQQQQQRAESESESRTISSRPVPVYYVQPAGGVSSVSSSQRQALGSESERHEVRTGHAVPIGSYVSMAVRPGTATVLQVPVGVNVVPNSSDRSTSSRSEYASGTESSSSRVQPGYRVTYYPANTYSTSDRSRSESESSRVSGQTEKYTNSDLSNYNSYNNRDSGLHSSFNNNYEDTQQRVLPTIDSSSSRHSSGSSGSSSTSVRGGGYTGVRIVPAFPVNTIESTSQQRNAEEREQRRFTPARPVYVSSSRVSEADDARDQYGRTSYTSRTGSAGEGTSSSQYGSSGSTFYTAPSSTRTNLQTQNQYQGQSQYQAAATGSQSQQQAGTTGYMRTGYGGYPRPGQTTLGQSSHLSSRFGSGVMSSGSDDLHQYMSESERLARVQQQQIAGSSRNSATLSSADEANRRTVNNAQHLDAAAANFVTGTNQAQLKGAFDTIETPSGNGNGNGNGFQRVKSWSKQSKWASGSEYDNDGKIKSHSMLSTAESEKHNVNGEEAGYKAATTTLENDGKVSTYSIHTP